MENAALMTTRLLHAMQSGDPSAASALYSHVYDELRRVAGVLMARQAPSHTLQPTALVNEAWIRVATGASTTAADRAHFMRVAARAMRGVLVDHARAKKARKRTPGDADLELSGAGVVDKNDARFEILDLNEALLRLSKEDPALTELVELRLFVGLTLEETAEVLQISVRQVHRSWTFARSWIRRQLNRGDCDVD